jgi:DNA-directed RNA polymerase specialized sigma24 family protein
MSDQDELLRGLRRGERDGFVRYFRLYRTPVYGFALRLLHDEDAAVAATVEALSAAFRRVILDESPSDLQSLTYRCALDACVAHAEGAAGAAAAHPAGSRFEAALASLDLRQRAALLLHDVHGLSATGLAVVFAVTADAAAALLFRAREEFRTALDERPASPARSKCRQAEEAAAGAVGIGLTGEELERLRRHAAYCRPCRKAMQGWRAGAFGLAVVLATPPPPPGLAASPVFGAAADASAAAGAGLFVWALRPAGRVLKSRAAAYVVAAACLALAVGTVLSDDTGRRFVLFESVGPAVQLVREPDAQATGPGRDAGEMSATTSSGVARALIGAQNGVLTGAQQRQTPGGTTVPDLSGRGATPAPEATGATAGQEASGDSAKDAASGAVGDKKRNGQKSHKADKAQKASQKAQKKSGKSQKKSQKADKAKKKPDKAKQKPDKAKQKPDKAKQKPDKAKKKPDKTQKSHKKDD